ncbi:START domain-containing protein [Kordia jejudonensis]|uniref:START domain-containing protein n=1 Tax=Kordia jejudonensis TaxID=1348245 RepID=UPI000629D204|nr:START domain-containing protein [Kordia jejudonensis]
MKIYIAVFCFLFFLPLSAQETWELKKDKNDIKIYTKTIDSTKLKAYKAEMTVKSTLEKVKNIIVDGDELHNWNYKAIDSKLIKKTSESEYTIWMAIDLPWPLRNRDFASHIRVEVVSKDVIRINLSSASDTYAVQEDYLRMTNFVGYWLLEKQGDTIKVTNEMYGDPGGSLPNWLINSTITRAPYYNFKALRNRVQ